METTRRQNGNDLEPCPSKEIECEVLDLSTKRLPSETPTPGFSSSLIPRSSPLSPPNKMRRLSTSVTCSTQDAGELKSRYSTPPQSETTTLNDAPYRTVRALSGTGIETTTYSSVQSISPRSRTSSDDLREQTNDARRFARRVEYSSFPFAELHGVSPVTHQPPPAIGTFPFNTAVNPFIRGFPGLGQPLLTDSVGSNLHLQGSVHPRMDFASATAAAFPSYLQRRRRRGQRCSDPTYSPLPSQTTSGLQHLTGGPRATDDDCSRESANGRPASSSRNSESEEKDPAYLERRRKNNEAAKRSRDARRQKEEEIAARAATLEQENITLKAELLLLRRESAELHGLLYGRIDPQR